MTRTAAALALATALYVLLASGGPGSGAGGPEDVAIAGAAEAEPLESPPEPNVEGVIVRFAPGATRAERATARQDSRTELDELLPVPGLQLLDPRPGVSVEEAVARLERSSAVLYAEPDVARSLAVLPNDRHFASLWGLHNTGQLLGGTGGSVDADIDAPEAWDVATGNPGIAVAVVDTGIDATHPDLGPNIWSNAAEARGTAGVDDDGNSLVDDVHGWDWVAGDSLPADEHGHGTHVAGTAGARGNDGAGVAGVAWRVGILPLRVLDATGSGRVSDAIRAYDYVREQQIRIVNASLGGSQFSRAEYDAIARASETLFVVAAGNETSDNDSLPTYPCNHPLPNVVCVAASDRDDRLASFSNFGLSTVDLAAPGTSILSTWPGGRFASLSGTSMATPHVAGAAALVWGGDPSLGVSAVRELLLSGTDAATGLAGGTATGGRLNAYRAVAGGQGAAQPGASPAADSPAAETSPPPAESPAAGDQTAPAPAEPAPLVPAPSPAPAPGQAAADATPPSLVVTVSSRQASGLLARRGLRALVRCSEACALRATLEVVRARGLRRGRVVARARGGVPEAGRARLVLRIPLRTLRALAGARLLLRVRAVDPAGNTEVRSRTVRLTR